MQISAIFPSMTTDDLARSAASDPHPPDGLTTAAQALWFAKAGRWHESHDLCQDISDPEGAWIHAHLHRQEGDLGNARYWYARAGRPAPASTVSIEDEWIALADALAS